MKYQVQEHCLTSYLPREVDHHNAESMYRAEDSVIVGNAINKILFVFETTGFMVLYGIGVIMG